MLSTNEQQRLRKAPYPELIDYIDSNNYIDSPERRGALQILEDRRTADLTEVIRQASESSKGLERRVFWLNVVLAAATVVGAAATVLMAFKT